MRKYSVLLIGILLQYFSQAVSGQVVTSVSGGNASGSGGTISYTIGQTIMSGVDDSRSLSQGFQQPYEILVVGIEELTGIDLDCSLFPNPATDFIKLNIKNYDGSGLHCFLYDMGGTLLFNLRIESSEIMVPMQGRKPGTYFLQLSDGKQVLKIFKIIKR